MAWPEKFPKISLPGKAPFGRRGPLRAQITGFWARQVAAACIIVSPQTWISLQRASKVMDWSHKAFSCKSTETAFSASWEKETT